MLERQITENGQVESTMRDLADAHIVRFSAPEGAEEVYVLEACDDYFEAYLNKRQVEVLILELTEFLGDMK